MFICSQRWLLLCVPSYAWYHNYSQGRRTTAANLVLSGSRVSLVLQFPFSVNRLSIRTSRQLLSALLFALCIGTVDEQSTMVSTPPLSAALSPSLSFTLTPTSSHHTYIAPTLDPVYIAAEAAAAVLASDSLVQAHSLSVLPPTPAALATLNGFLDHLVLILLFRARSSLIDPLRNAVKQVFKNQLAHDAIAEGEAELRAYIRTPEEENALLGTPAPTSSDSTFDTELAWRMARVRCMVYSSLGNVDESDVLKYTPEQRSLFSTNDSVDLPDLISPIATIFLTAILEFVAEHVLLVAGRAVLSRYLVASTSRPHLATGVLLLEEVDVDKLALDPQVGKVWRHWQKRGRELPLNTIIQYPSTSPTLTQTLEQAESVPATPNQAQVLAPSADIFGEAITATPNGKYKKVRPISVDNGVLSLDADNSPSAEEEYDEPTRQLGERSIPVTPAIIQERRKSRPWSFHGQRFSLYESFAALTGTTFASPMGVTKENVQVPSTNQKMESTVQEGIDEESSAQLLDQMIADIGSQPSSSTTPGRSVANLTRQLLPEAFDTAPREGQQLETEQSRTIDFDVSDEPNNNTISDRHPASPALNDFSESQLDNAVYEGEEHVGAIPSYDYDVDGDSFDGTIDDDDDRNRSRRRPSSMASEGKSNDGDNDVPVILLASAPPSRYSRSYSIAERPDAASTTFSKRLSTSGISTKMKGKSSRPIAETTIPGFGTTVPTEKVRKYIWISNQKFDDGSGSSESNTSVKAGSPELEHVTFERLLQSDITYKLNLTPDKLREAKPFYDTNHTRASLVNEQSTSVAKPPEPRSGSVSSISPTSQFQSELPTTRSSSSGSISTVSASQQPVSGSPSTRSRSSTLRRLPKSSSVSHASQSSPDDRQPANNGTLSLPPSATAALQPLKHDRNESVKVAAGATHELMNLLRLSSSREDLKDDNELSPKSRRAPAKSLEYVRPATTEKADEHYHSQARQKGDVNDTPVPEIPERYKQSQSPQQSTHQVKRSPSIMNRLGFSGVIGGAAKSESTPLRPTSSGGGTHSVYRNSGESRHHGTSNSSRSSSSSLVGVVSGIGIPRPASNDVYKTMPGDKIRGKRESPTADLANFLRTTGPDESPYQASCESLSSPEGLTPEKNHRSSLTNKTGFKGSSNSLPKRDRKKGVRLLGFLKGEKHVAV
ncbi:uncharacterized protein V1513DRAFT_465901 [Lipomyces chichibuensis]|uniref:uncharacterized protein n=1 Tax=Lipomyces chichibuensis TaxID=1546026 RepID=UPI0033433304